MSPELAAKLFGELPRHTVPAIIRQKLDAYDAAEAAAVVTDGDAMQQQQQQHVEDRDTAAIELLSCLSLLL